MKYYHRLLLIFFGLFFSATISAQHKIVWDVNTGDTSQQRSLFKQINNVLTEAPDTKIELVFHGSAVYALLKDTGYNKEQIIGLSKRGVVFAACNNSLRSRGIDTSRVMQQAIIVPVAILELVKKEEEGWAYIKFG